MSSKMKPNGLNGVHTAGIYADMTVDGPEIGTLVVIVDRAKNLPNRKTIGKQDPYCAARLGKEAKKTETDRRGGQTPRWDQELRFTVHDSPDYYQLKVSVFNDDKKTEIIGETWVNLQEVVVPGGGQNDLWHNLTYRSKYAGEIRVEITYYDTRPKQEKSEKVKQNGANGVADGIGDSVRGPRQPKTPVKRRPLPSDPVTGAPPPPPNSDPAPIPVRAYQSLSTAIPDHVQTPPRGHQVATYIPNQSPLQNIEYSTPPHRFSQSQGYGDSWDMGGYGTHPGVILATPAAQPMPNDRYEIYDPMERNDRTQPTGMDHYGDKEGNIDRDERYDPWQAPYELPRLGEFETQPSPGDRPPQPPAHRSRNDSQHVSPAPAMTSHGSYGSPSDTRAMNQYDTPPHEFHRHSMPAYSQSNSYQAYSPSASDGQFRKSANGYQQSPPRNHSYDSRYNGDYGSMQPFVEDAPPTPSPANYSAHKSGGSRVSQYDERRYDEVPSPAPLNLSGQGSASSGRYSASTPPSHQYSNSSIGYGSTNSPVSFRDHLQTGASVSSRTSYGTIPQQNQTQRRPSDDQMAGSLGGYGLPPVPPTLVAGMDPGIAKEISDRIYQEKRASFNPSAGNSQRVSHQDSLQYQPNRSHTLSYQEAAGLPFVSVAPTYDDRQSRFIPPTTNTPVVKPRAISPHPRTPNRKSVSPSPGAADGRRLSGVPFGPDSYNALNPSLSNSTSPQSLSAKYDSKVVDPDAKIITHDGREVDPSDHIPESNYAPLRETKGPKYASQLPDRSSRGPPNTAQPSTTSGRRPLRQAGRPQSVAASSTIYMNSRPADPSTPPTGRNRLQKKTNQISAQNALHPSPLAPISAYQDNCFMPRNLPRVNPGDYSGENYVPQNYGSSPGYRGIAGPPPIPAKIPMEMNGLPPPQPAGAEAWALLEEMKNIDLGSGRARRRGH